MLEERFPYPQSDLAKEHYGKGLSEGVQKGEAAALLRLLSRRFGEIGDTVVQRVQAADTSELNRWLDRVIDAPTLEAVFASD